MGEGWVREFLGDKRTEGSGSEEECTEVGISESGLVGDRGSERRKGRVGGG